LLEGKRATAHWGLARLYAEHYPNVDWHEEYLVTDCGDVASAGGVNGAADVSLYLVEKHCGREIALKTARSLCIEMPRTWQNSFTHFELRAGHDDGPERAGARARGAVCGAHNHHPPCDGEPRMVDGGGAEGGRSRRDSARRFKDA